MRKLIPVCIAAIALVGCGTSNDSELELRATEVVAWNEWYKCKYIEDC